MLFHSEGMINGLISLITNSKYSHAGMYFGEIEGREFFAEVDWVPSSLNPLDCEKRDYDIYRIENLSDEDRKKIKESIIDNLGIEYDYGQLISFPLKFISGFDRFVFNDPNKYICTEFVDVVYYSAGINLVKNEELGLITPKKLANIDKSNMAGKSRAGEITYFN